MTLVSSLFAAVEEAPVVDAAWWGLDFLSSIGSIVLGASAVILALGVIFDKTPLGKIGRWFAHRLITDPLAEWFQTLITNGVRSELGRTNGGSAFGDHAARMEQVGSNVVRIEAHVSKIEEAMHAHIETHHGPPGSEGDQQ